MNRSKVGYVDDIEEMTKKNPNFRNVLYTGKYMQLVVMSLEPGEEIGVEVHSDVDQFFRLEKGKGTVVMNGEETKVEDDYAMIVPAGVEHNFINTGNKTVKLYTIYTPPNHPEGTVHRDKAEAEAYEEDHHH